jgi:ubiquinone/menaquinone biosynthesis C-methylase UbiE
VKNFDRVADIYDATRELPAFVPNRIADRVVTATHATAETRFLEIGVGTGRIALPFLERGYEYTGVDISERMMERLRAKVHDRHANLTLVNADITELPFEDESFDVAIGVHILHLVPEWQRAIAEVRRVLAPNGYLVLGHEDAAPDDAGQEIRRQWQAFVRELGTNLTTRSGSWPAIEAELIDEGAYISAYRVAHWVEELRPSTLLDEQRTRVFSHSWEVPDDVLEAVHQRMLTWTTERYGSPDTALRSEGEFLLSVSRFPPES